MPETPLPLEDPALDDAMSLMLADHAGAAAKARAVLDAGDAAAERRALAACILSLALLRDGDADAAAAALRQARALAGQESPERLRDFMEHVVAHHTRHAGRLVEACAALAALHARAALRPLPDAYLTATSLGVVQSMLGDDDTSLDTMYQALHLARRSGVRSYVVNALSNLGSYEADLHNLEDALPLLEEAVAGALAIGSRRQLIFSVGNLVQCLTRRGDAARALQVVREQLMPAIRPDDPPALQRDDEIAAALLANGQVDEADAVLQRELYEGTMTNELATARVGLLARVRLARGDAAGALALCNERRAVLEGATHDEVTPPIDRIELLRIGADAAAAVGDHRQAHALLLQAFTLHEELLGRAARSRRLSLQITHRLHQAEWERDSARQVAAALEDLNASLRAEAAENERLKRQLIAHAFEDPLTGLPNRRHLFDAAQRLFATQARRGGGLAVALVDLDHFKQVNDRHGHDAGDAVLCGFADLLRRSVRAGDIACRYGGEEFVLLMSDIGAERAAERLRELLARFRERRFDGRDGAFTASFSAGTAAWQGEGESLEALLRRADGALYAAKAAGRAAVHVAAGTPSAVAPG